MKKPSLVIVLGRLDSISFLRMQLQIGSMFELRTSKGLYRDVLKNGIEREKSGLEFYWDSQMLLPMTVGELRSHLTQKNVNWTQYRNVIVLPASVFLIDDEFRARLFEKLHLSDQPAIFPSRPEIVSLPKEILDDSSLSDRELGDLDPLLVIEPEQKWIELSASSGLFELSQALTKTRYFNELKLDGIFIRKKVVGSAKGLKEYNFYKNLPSHLQPYFPCVTNYQGTKSEHVYELEFIPMFDASRLLIHGTVDVDVFRKILNKIDQYLKSCPTNSLTKEEFQKEFRALFVDKLKSRLEDLEALPLPEAFKRFETFIHPNGVRGLVNELVQKLEARISKLRETSLVFSHGDLCLSNVLYDRVSDRIKLIDPRGIDELDDAFMPLYYDLAKLSHSMLGYYDLIMNGLSHVSIDEELMPTLEFGIDASYLDQVSEIFTKWVEAQGWDLELLRLCEASLFFSMLPLHKDQPAKMIQQLVAGLVAMEGRSKCHKRLKLDPQLTM